MTTLLLDTHVLHWWSAEPERLSDIATAALETADELAVSDVTWLELARLGVERRLVPPVPVRTWLEILAREVRTIPMSPAIAVAAMDLPRTFPGDPADRVIWATAIEHGLRLVTKDRRLLEQDEAGAITLW